ncbi:MAG: hypothetical protein ACPG61_11500 [Paracoccaceae bacterium]
MNQRRGVVPFEVDGRRHELRLDVNAMIQYEDHAGETVIQGLGEIQKAEFDAKRLRALFWVALVDDVSIEDAGALMSDVGFVEAAKLIGAAAQAAFPPGEPGNETAGDKPRKKPTAKT